MIKLKADINLWVNPSQIVAVTQNKNGNTVVHLVASSFDKAVYSNEPLEEFIKRVEEYWSNN